MGSVYSEGNAHRSHDADVFSRCHSWCHLCSWLCDVGLNMRCPLSLDLWAFRDVVVKDAHVNREEKKLEKYIFRNRTTVWEICLFVFFADKTYFFTFFLSQKWVLESFYTRIKAVLLSKISKCYFLMKVFPQGCIFTIPPFFIFSRWSVFLFMNIF